jgi:hypothetical protein
MVRLIGPGLDHTKLLGPGPLNTFADVEFTVPRPAATGPGRDQIQITAKDFDVASVSVTAL